MTERIYGDELVPSIANLLADGDFISVVDVGAALAGKDGYQDLIEAGKARLVAFEPDPAERDKLARSLGPNHNVLPYFVGDGAKRVFYETNWALTGSLYEPNSEAMAFFDSLSEVATLRATHEVPTRRLDDIDEITDVDLLKMDIQGAELDALKAGTRVLSLAVMVVVEVEFVELYRDQPLFGDVDKFLRDQGFQFHTFEGFGSRAFRPFRHPESIGKGFRQLLWSDACYVRDWRTFDKLPVQKLMKLGVLAHDLFGSFDLAHLAMQSVDHRIGTQYASEYAQWLSE